MIEFSTTVQDLAGGVGAALYLSSYAALQIGIIRGEGYLYPALNASAAALVLVSLGAYFNPFSATIETAWILISLFGIVRLWYLTRGLVFTDEERAFLDLGLPGLSRLGARRFLSAGKWSDVPAGAILTEEDRPVESLVWIADGGAVVSHRGRAIAALPAGRFVGELGVLSQAPATATVKVSQQSRLFAISRAALSRVIVRNPDVKLALDAGFGGDARSKILAGNLSFPVPSSVEQEQEINR